MVETTSDSYGHVLSKHLISSPWTIRFLLESGSSYFHPIQPYPTHFLRFLYLSFGYPTKCGKYLLGIRHWTHWYTSQPIKSHKNLNIRFTNFPFAEKPIQPLYTIYILLRSEIEYIVHVRVRCAHECDGLKSVLNTKTLPEYSQVTLKWNTPIWRAKNKQQAHLKYLSVSGDGMVKECFVYIRLCTRNWFSSWVNSRAAPCCT